MIFEKAGKRSIFDLENKLRGVIIKSQILVIFGKGLFF